MGDLGLTVTPRNVSVYKGYAGEWPEDQNLITYWQFCKLVVSECRTSLRYHPTLVALEVTSAGSTVMLRRHVRL